MCKEINLVIFLRTDMKKEKCIASTFSSHEG